MKDVVARLWPGLFRDVALNAILASPIVPVPLRWRALKAYGMDVEPSRISPKVWFGSSRVSIGNGTFINYGCMFNTTAAITIGKRCNIAMGVKFITASHKMGDAARRAGEATMAPVTVGDGTWIGAGVIVLPGVTIGAGSIIAAGAVVVADCEPSALYAGVPARKVRNLDQDADMITA